MIKSFQKVEWFLPHLVGKQEIIDFSTFSRNTDILNCFDLRNERLKRLKMENWEFLKKTQKYNERTFESYWWLIDINKGVIIILSSNMHIWVMCKKPAQFY